MVHNRLGSDFYLNLRDSLTELANGLTKVASTLHSAGSPGDTAAALINLAPILIQTAENLQVWGGLGIHEIDLKSTTGVEET